jgi:hypothetical protein
MKVSKTKRIVKAIVFALITPIVIWFILPVVYVQHIIKIAKGE